MVKTYDEEMRFIRDYKGKYYLIPVKRTKEFYEWDAFCDSAEDTCLNWNDSWDFKDHICDPTVYTFTSLTIK